MTKPNPQESFFHQRMEHLKAKGFTPQLILDIGAHRGDWSAEMHELWPTAEMFMIDANEECRPHLLERKNIGGYEIALLGAEERSYVPYYASTKEFNTGNSVYKEQTHFYDDAEVRQLPMTTLDAVMRRNKLNHADFIKIDTQGSELDIIRGGKKTLSNAEFVLLETQIVEYNLGAPKASELIAHMSQSGFQPYDVTQMMYLPTGELMQLDMLFVRSDSRFVPSGRLF